MLIKVCGIADAVNARQVAGLSPYMMGFIFYRPSPRNAFGLPPEVVRALPSDIKRVGVFVDEAEGLILRAVEEYGLDFVQLHGNETPAFCRLIKNKVGGVIKAFGMAGLQDAERTIAYEGICDLYVFDTKTPSKGGSGVKFDHSLLKSYRGATPFLLSGGIGPEDTGLSDYPHPRFAGLDLNSRFETTPGVKDTGLLENFIKDFKDKRI